jgi:hypothetical protein
LSETFSSRTQQTQHPFFSTRKNTRKGSALEPRYRTEHAPKSSLTFGGFSRIFPLFPFFPGFSGFFRYCPDIFRIQTQQDVALASRLATDLQLAWSLMS